MTRLLALLLIPSLSLAATGQKVGVNPNADVSHARVTSTGGTTARALKDIAADVLNTADGLGARPARVNGRLRTVLFGTSRTYGNGGLKPGGYVASHYGSEAAGNTPIDSLSWQGRGPFVVANAELGWPFDIVENFGSPGDDTNGFIGRFDANLASAVATWGQIDAIIIDSGGVNDGTGFVSELDGSVGGVMDVTLASTAGQPGGEPLGTMANMRHVLRRARTVAPLVIVLNETGGKAGWSRTTVGTKAQIARYNEWLQRECAKIDCIVWDAWSAVVNPLTGSPVLAADAGLGSLNKADTMLNDEYGVHPSNYGASLQAALLVADLRARGFASPRRRRAYAGQNTLGQAAPDVAHDQSGTPVYPSSFRGNAIPNPAFGPNYPNTSPGGSTTANPLTAQAPGSDGTVYSGIVGVGGLSTGSTCLASSLPSGGGTINFDLIPPVKAGDWVGAQRVQITGGTAGYGGYALIRWANRQDALPQATAGDWIEMEAEFARVPDADSAFEEGGWGLPFDVSLRIYGTPANVALGAPVMSGSAVASIPIVTNTGAGFMPNVWYAVTLTGGTGTAATVWAEGNPSGDGTLSRIVVSSGGNYSVSPTAATVDPSVTVRSFYNAQATYNAAASSTNRGAKPLTATVVSPRVKLPPNFGRIDAFATVQGKGIFTIRRPSLRIVPPSAIVASSL